MRLVGYCEKCHRVRPVKVSGHGMSMLAARRIATGICTSCEDKEDRQRRERMKR